MSSSRPNKISGGSPPRTSSIYGGVKTAASPSSSPPNSSILSKSSKTEEKLSDSPPTTSPKAARLNRPTNSSISNASSAHSSRALPSGSTDGRVSPPTGQTPGRSANRSPPNSRLSSIPNQSNLGRISPPPRSLSASPTPLPSETLSAEVNNRKSKLISKKRSNDVSVTNKNSTSQQQQAQHSSRLAAAQTQQLLSEPQPSLLNSPVIDKQITNGIDFESKSKPELAKLTSKYLTELSIKNRIIHDLRANENWLKAQLVLLNLDNKELNMKTDIHPLNSALDIVGKSKLSKEDVNKLKSMVLLSMMEFKKELSSAQSTIEENITTLKMAEKQRLAAQEEASYLQSILDSVEDPTKMKNMERAKIIELKKQLKSAANDITTLQSKVSLWCRASKKNQEVYLF